MKKTILLPITITILLAIIIPTVLAEEVECNKVFVVNFNYDNGYVTYKDKVIKCGHSPDRKIQPLNGYRAEIISINNRPLYSFKFDIPLTTNFDMSDPIVKSLSGGMVVLNETNFALIFPYYDKAKSIRIYNPREYEVATIPLIEEQFIQKRTTWWLLIVLLLLIIAAYMVYRHYRKAPQPSKNL